MTIEQIIAKIADHYPPADIALIKKAYNFAVKAHDGQKRLTGEPYIQHPLHTAFILAQLNADAPIVAAGLLHDVPEDTKYKLPTIKKLFGEDIAFLVGSVTKLSLISYRGQER